MTCWPERPWKREDGSAAETIVDWRAVGRLRDALTGSHRAGAAERKLAREIEAARPGTGQLVESGEEFHRRASEWAVTEGGARSVVYAAAGRPPHDGALHARAAAAAPDARFAYVFGDPETELFTRSHFERTGAGRVAFARGCCKDQEGWLREPGIAELTALGPVSVQLVLALHWWPPELCYRVLLAFRRELPPGSTVCMSCGIVSGPQAREYADLLSEGGGGRIRLHSREQIAGWIGMAGMVLHPAGVTDARAWQRPWGVPRRPAAGPCVVEAVCSVPG